MRVRKNDERLDAAVLLDMFDQIGALQVLLPKVKGTIEDQNAHRRFVSTSLTRMSAGCLLRAKRTVTQLVVCRNARRPSRRADPPIERANAAPGAGSR